MAATTVPSGARPQRAARVAQVLYASTIVLAILLPFELIRPVIVLPQAVFTNLELAVIFTALIWAAQLALSAPSTIRRLRVTAAANRDIILPAASFVLIALISAILAPSHRLEALKFVTHFASGLYVFALVTYIARTSKRLAGLLWALLLGASVSALLGVLEAWNWRAAGLLQLFKVAPTLVGGTLRVSATFQYATITAMFLEMTVPVAVGLAATARSRAARALATSSACICTIVVVLTLTRAGIVTLALILAAGLALAWRRPRWKVLAAPAALALLALLLTAGLQFLMAPEFRARLTTENDSNWYNAEYVAPPALSVVSGDWITAAIRVRNTGQATWQPTGEHAYALGARWLVGDDRQELGLPRRETALARDVSPGDAITLTVSLQAALPPGAYYLSWGMLQRDILWFRHRNVAEAETAVQVLPAAQVVPGVQVPPLPPIIPADDMSAVPPTLSRLQLWRAAWLMLKERPLLGAGPDNFRHLHGQYIGLTNWNTSIFANNLSLELLADLGIPGLLVFAWLLLAVAWRLWRAVRRSSADPVAVWAVCLGGSLLAFVIHGLLDYFLGITSMYLLFWMTLGLIVAACRLLVRDESYRPALTR